MIGQPLGYIFPDAVVRTRVALWAFAEELPDSVSQAFIAPTILLVPVILLTAVVLLLVVIAVAIVSIVGTRTVAEFAAEPIVLSVALRSAVEVLPILTRTVGLSLRTTVVVASEIPLAAKPVLPVRLIAIVVVAPIALLVLPFLALVLPVRIA